MSPRAFEGYWSAELTRTKQKTDNGEKKGIRKLREGEQGRVIVGRLIERLAGAPASSKDHGKVCRAVV
jgi:hypothetical protein